MVSWRTTSLIFSVITILLFLFPVYADFKIIETRYHLDTGAYFTWGMQGDKAIWEKGKYDSPVTYRMDRGINLAVNRDPATIKIIKVIPYNGSNFDFNKPESFTWNTTQYAKDQDTYRDNYFQYSLSNLQSAGVPQYDTNTGELIFGYSGVLISNRRIDSGGAKVDPRDALNGDFDVKSNIEMNQSLIDMENWMGEIPEVTRTPMLAMLNPDTSDFLMGFLYFAPMVIEYQIIDPTIPLISPIVLIGCKAESMFIGLPTPIRGSVLNRNEKPVITYYTLTANGSKVMASGWALQDGGKSKKVESSYTIPADTKPGTQFVFKLEARQTWAYNAPERYLPIEEGKPQEDNPAYEPFINSHTYVSAVNAWYKKDAPWVNGEATCRKTAVLLPEAPLNHEMNPSVIVE